MPWSVVIVTHAVPVQILHSSHFRPTVSPVGRAPLKLLGRFPVWDGAAFVSKSSLSQGTTTVSFQKSHFPTDANLLEITTPNSPGKSTLLKIKIRFPRDYDRLV